MFDYNLFRALSPTTLADTLSGSQVMDIGIRPLWAGMPRVAGPAYTVECGPGDNLMLHAAIYRAAPGSVIVVKAEDVKYAVSGGNVCRVAQKRGIAAFVVDGVVRDVAEARENSFPIFARGISPIPGGKEIVTELNQPVQCGGVRVEPGDCVVGDEEGIVVVPVLRLAETLEKARKRAVKDAAETLEDWEADHHARIEAILKSKSFKG